MNTIKFVIIHLRLNVVNNTFRVKVSLGTPSEQRNQWTQCSKYCREKRPSWILPRKMVLINTSVHRYVWNTICMSWRHLSKKKPHKFLWPRFSFQLLGGVLIELFGEELGAEFTSDTQGAWLKAYGVMETIILNQCAELDKIAAESKEGPLVKGWTPASPLHRWIKIFCRIEVNFKIMYRLWCFLSFLNDV